MRIKCQHDGRAANFACHVKKFLYKLSMAQMDAVEIANRHSAAAQVVWKIGKRAEKSQGTAV